jgi:hypothetical protein
MARLTFSSLNIGCIIFMMLACGASAQTSQAQAPRQTTTSAKTANSWDTLTDQQKVALAPLRNVWVRITPVKKQKWLDISVGYHLLSPEGQATLHFRMTEWASLTTKEREQARINFAQTKKLSSDDKQSKWQAYQALSPEEKQKLSNINKTTPVTGAAPALKPVPKDKLLITPQANAANGSTLKTDAGKTPQRAVIVNPAVPPQASK